MWEIIGKKLKRVPRGRIQTGTPNLPVILMSVKEEMDYARQSCLTHFSLGHDTFIVGYFVTWWFFSLVRLCSFELSASMRWNGTVFCIRRSQGLFSLFCFLCCCRYYLLTYIQCFKAFSLSLGLPMMSNNCWPFNYLLLNIFKAKKKKGFLHQMGF